MQPLRLASVLVLAAAWGRLSAQTPPLEKARPNDNRARAGVSQGNVLAVRLEARLAMWHPNGDDQPGAPIPVFAELGRPAQVPGPMIRVAGGTDVIAIVRNALPGQMLTIHGLHARPAVGAAFNDSVVLAPGQIRTLRFRLDRPGTYYYWGTTSGRAFGFRTGEDAQLSGAIVVDEPGQRAPRDRVFLIGMWADTAGSETARHRRRQLFVVNGRAWPHTDRLVYAKGETVQWRVINASADVHPMHLHGFYFRVDRRGNGRADSVNASRDLVNTERMMPGSTMLMTWTPDRLGNWLFHCHTPAHIEARGPLGMPLDRSTLLAQAGSAHGDHEQSMSGLATGVEIRPAEDDTTAPPPPAEPVRRLRMFIQPNLGSTPWRPYYGIGVSEDEFEPPQGQGQSAGPPIVVDRGEPVSIMVHNRTSEPTAIHWHGMELESYYDGVAGFSGVRPQVTPVIAPSDSFEVRFTPPRAGTFIYHSHHSEARQQRAGIVGALVVADKGRDASREVMVLVSSPSDSTDEERAVLLNGSLTPVAPVLRRAIAYRLRLINITTGRPSASFELRQDSTLATWRALAKDGAELPAARRVVRPARQLLSIGETMDVEFFPTAAGDYRLEIRTAGGTLLGTLPLRVQ